MNYLGFSAFKEKRDFKNKTDFLIQFEDFLEKQLRDRKNFILIIDEAQKLSFEILEEIRLLSNLETSEENLFNIFLVGQPELNELLNQPRCRPLLQRISIRYHISAHDEAGSLEYVSTRLKLAGAENPEKVFPRNVARTIFRYPKLSCTEVQSELYEALDQKSMSIDGFRGVYESTRQTSISTRDFINYLKNMNIINPTTANREP
jgi:hypothetical protein